MKKLQVMISDELMKASKLFALQSNTTLKEVVSLALQQFIGQTEQTTHPHYHSSTLEEIKAQPSDCFIIRKTHQTSNFLPEGFRYQNGSFIWHIMPDCKAHYDINGDIIPYRFTGPDGTVYEPDADEIQDLEEHFGKKVKIEE